ncbi:MAG: hypothetical protein U0802_24505 [Candidatus Binatia bacterium]
MALTLDQAKNELWALVRTIDRKADLSVVPHTGGEPAVSITVTLRKHKANLVIAARDIEAAQESAMQRSQLRTTIKRAVDRATFVPPPMASTKVNRGPDVDGGFFRASGPRSPRR